ncbi:MAG: class I SAM-dependent methyltransferase [Egibacteraceae bacterium]
MTASVSPGTPDSAKVQARITSYWSGDGESYDAAITGRVATAKDAWADVWLGALPEPPADTLDVGTGTGEVSLLLAELGYRVTGIDLSEGMLGRARAKSAGMANLPTLAIGDAVAPAFPPASFDAVTNRFLLWTLREPQRALANWRRLLRPGGVLAVVDGIWGGFRRDDESMTETWNEFISVYDERVAAALPLSEAETPEVSVSAVRDAGFTDVRVTWLTEIEAIERREAESRADPDEKVYPYFRITARP